MKKSAFFATVLATGLFAGAAQAQTPFDGGYAGFGLGYGSGTVSSFDGTGSLGINGGVGGVFAGWNFSNANIVYGVEADLSFANIQGDAVCANPTWNCDAKVQAFGTLRGRLGVVDNNTLFYATAGAAAGRVKLTTTNAGGTKFPGTQTSTGWVAGFGVEGNVGASQWRYRAEYLHHDLGSKTYMTDVAYTSKTKFGVARFAVVWSF